MTQFINKRFSVLFVLSCIPIALSYYFFLGQSLRLDESQSLWQISRNVPDIFAIVAADVHVPLYHLLLHFWVLFFGNTITVARTMSLFFYCISIPALYLLGSKAYSRPVGLFAAFLFSVSPFMNWYGNEIRMYTLFTFFVILNQYFFIQIFKQPSKDSTETGMTLTRTHVWIGFIVTAVAGVFSHYFFLLMLAAQMTFYFLRQDLFPPGSLWRFVLATVIISASLAPWAWYVLHLGQAVFQEPTLIMPTTVNLFSTFSQFIFGFQNDNLNTFFLSLWPVTVIFALFTLQRGKRMLPETEYFLVSIIVPFTLAFLGSFIVAPIFVSRYLIFTVPSLYLLLASLFSNYPRHVAVTAQCALAALMILTLRLEIINPTTPVKENYEQATAFLNTHATAQDVIVLTAPFTVYPVQYYYRGPAPITTLPVWNQYAYGPIPPFSEQTFPQDLTQVTANSQNVYLLLSYNQGYEAIIHTYFESHYQRIYQEKYSTDLNLYVYKLRYDTTLSAAPLRLK